MSYIKESFEAVKTAVLAAQDVYSRVYVGALPSSDSLCMQISAGYETGVRMAGNTLRVVCVVNAKHQSQESVLEALCDIHETLNARRACFIGTGWTVTSVKTTSIPTYIEHDGDQYLYGSSIEYLLECE